MQSMNAANNVYIPVIDEVMNGFIPVILQIIIFAIFIFFVCYLLGSIPFGVIFTRLAGLGDIRKIGSGNTGATNVLRTGSKKLAAATLLCDMLKGTAAVVLAFCFLPIMEIGLIAGFAALLGHIFPVWLKFRGGKGVATYLGVMLGLFWPLAVLFIAVWLATAFLTRYSSLSALVALVAVPVCAWFFIPVIVSPFMSPEAARIFITAGILLMSLIIILRHHANICRLLNGTESRIGSKAG